MREDPLGANRRCLVTGCAGFIGSHLAAYLSNTVGLEVCGLTHSSTPEGQSPSVALIQADIADHHAITRAVAFSRPRWIFHLAARSGIQQSWADPTSTFIVNVMGTFHLLEAIRTAGLEPPPVLVLLGSSAEYGLVQRDELPLREGRALRPSSPYGISKAAQDRLAETYGHAHGLPVIRVRAFYVTGPGKADACAEFAKGLLGGDEHGSTLVVGNLEAVRDPIDVRDAVEALWLLALRGSPGEVYNLCCGTGYSMRRLLGMLIDLCGRRPLVREDPARFRPADDPYLVGDNSKLTALGWRPKVPVEQTLLDILEFWRARKGSLPQAVC